MTLKETAAVMTILKVAYPGYYNRLGGQEAKDAVNLWHSMLSDYPAETVTNAVKAVIATNKFPPSVAEVIEKIALLTKREDKSEIAAWGLVKKAVRNSTYNSKEEFDALPEDIQRVLGTHHTLREWAVSEQEDSETVIASNFMRSYRAGLADKKIRDALPNDLKIMIQQDIKTMIENKGE